jgi:K+-transporting ATPase KdpF subunit
MVAQRANRCERARPFVVRRQKTVAEAGFLSIDADAPSRFDAARSEKLADAPSLCGLYKATPTFCDVLSPPRLSSPDRQRVGEEHGTRRRFDLYRTDRRFFCDDRVAGAFLRAPHGQKGKQAMNGVYWLSGIAAVAIFAYLLVALFKPELFS